MPPVIEDCREDAESWHRCVTVGRKGAHADHVVGFKGLLRTFIIRVMPDS